MKIYTHLEQGSQEWLDARAGILTASTIGKFITPKTVTPSRGEAAITMERRLIAERLTGRVEPVIPSAAMTRGTLDEPIARAAYEKHTGQKVQQVGFITETFGGETLGYSPDGLVGEDGLIEIKSRTNERHLRTILTGQPPAENMAQLQTGLLVTGRAWIDYVSFSAGMPLYIVRVTPNERWQAAIREVLRRFREFATWLDDIYRARTNGLPVMEVPEHYTLDFEPEINL